jgi:2-iminobutanoate/2-iminopropanoate deaminase
MYTSDHSTTYGPYSPVKKAGNFFYISGQIGVDPKSSKSPKSIGDQTVQALKNMSGVLGDFGLNMSDVVKTTIYITDMSQFNEVNKVYETFFDEPRPARSTVGVKELPNVSTNPILVEIEAVAYKEKP